MKRLFVLAVLLLPAAGAFAFSFSQFQGAFQGFASDVAGSLPLESSVGLNWSDAYVGQLLDAPPHFGVGVTVGAATIPFAAIKSAVNAFGGSMPSFLSSSGLPFPAYTVDARIGGFVLPFDIGLKFGYLPPDALSSVGIRNYTADYLVVGGDLRYALLRDQGVMPGLSVGVGYTYMRGAVGIPGILSGSIPVTSAQFPDGSTHNLSFTNPSMDFIWSSSVVDAKVQLSKTFFILTPFVGAGVSYGFSRAGGGLQSSMTIDGKAPTQSQIDAINSANGTSYTLANPGFAVKAAANGFSARAFGGFSFNVLIVKIGLGAEYEFLTGSMAGMVNARVQL